MNEAAAGGTTPGGGPEQGSERTDGPPDEQEPDYRFTLANERTFLAWVRTSLAMLAAAVAVVVVPALPPPVRTVGGAVLAALSALAAAGGALRWQRVDHAIRRARPLPPQRVPWVVAAGLVVLALVGLALAVIGGPA